MEKVSRIRTLQKNATIGKANKYLDDLSEQVSDSFNLFGFSLIKLDQLNILIQQIKSCIPEEIENALRILDERDKILEEARKNAEEIHEKAVAQAEKIINEANEEKDQILSEHNILLEANARAEELIENAKEEANNTMNYAYNYVNGAFDTFINGFEELQNQTSTAKKQLVSMLDSFSDTYSLRNRSETEFKKEEYSNNEYEDEEDGEEEYN